MINECYTNDNWNKENISNNFATAESSNNDNDQMSNIYSIQPNPPDVLL